MTILPYGEWPSPITTDLLVEKVVRLSQLQVHDGELYWVEGRPAEQGRSVVVRHGAGDVTPADTSARTLVHEYGGGDYAVVGGRVVWSEFTSQRITIGDAPLTADDGARYADYDVHPDGSNVACVRERHLADGSVVNDVVRVSLEDGSVQVVAAGHDFFAAPRWALDGRLAWLAWDHANMPWDGTTLYLDGTAVAGGPEESITQPRWSPDGVLHWVSDRTGWWNLYAEGSPVAPLEVEFGFPDWVFGAHTYDWLPDGRLVAAYTSEGVEQLAVVEGGEVHTIDLPFGEYASVVTWADGLAAIAGSPTASKAVVTVDVEAGSFEVVRPSRESAVGEEWISVPQPVSFPSGTRTAHALYYPPANPESAGPEEERPPLVVMSHGGPTSATSSTLDLSVQFFTSRGIAVVDVNYGGSTGYGRPYRRLLDGAWGVVDVEDCVNAARWLADQGLVDGDRLAIRGGSAGGYTTLCALTFTDVFAVGASYYGVADAEALATDTHKFESRYLDGLIGPYPAARGVYRARSPIHFVDQLRVPVILLQGLEDKVVPPSQAEVMVEALQRNGILHEYVPFEGEQHGFRQADTIKRAAAAELSFYGRVLGFTPAL